MNNTFLKNLAVWLLIGFLVFLIVDFYNANNTQVSTKNISYSSFLDDVKNGNVSSVQIRGNNILGKYNDGSSFTTYSPNDLGLIDKLEKNNIEIIAQPLRKKFTRITRCLNFLVSNASVDWCMDFLHEANAVWYRKSYGFWKI